MATTISKINVYKNNEWESYPISTTASNVVTKDGNLTNTINSLENNIKNLTDTIIPGLSTNIESKLSTSGNGKINGDLVIAGNLDVTNDITVDGQLTAIDINSNKVFTDKLRILDSNNGTSQNNYLDLSMTDAQASISVAGTDPSTGQTVSPNYLKIMNGFVNGRTYYDVKISHPALWRNALNVEHLDTAETSGTNRYTRYMKFEDGSLICMVEVIWKGSITTTYGSMFYNDSVINGGNWPIAFTGVPYVSMTCARGGTAFVGPATSMSNTSIGTLYLYRPLQNADQQQAYYIDIIGYGRWK